MEKFENYSETHIHFFTKALLPALLRETTIKLRESSARLKIIDVGYGDQFYLQQCGDKQPN